MKKLLLFVLLLLIVLGGCAGTEKSSDNNDIKEKNQQGVNRNTKENLIPIQEYTGEGYELKGARKETGEIANAHRDEVEEAVVNYFQDEYQTEVKVHNFVSAVDAVSVFVESIGEPHFYTNVVVPVDIKNQQLMTDNVFSEGKQVDRAIGAGLYAMAFGDEFQELDSYLEDIVEEYPVIGRTEESIANVRGDGFSTPYYRFTPAGDIFKKLSGEYLKNPEITKDELKDFFQENEFETKYVNIVIELFMSETNVEADANLFEKVLTDIEEMNNLPRGEYIIIINDNEINKKTSRGLKDNSQLLTSPNEIVKE